MKQKGRVIFHVDMNSYYASVEVREDPSLHGKPLVIAGNQEQRRGVVLTASYEARKHGIRTGMTVWEAKKLCPGLLMREPRFSLYRIYSEKIFLLFRTYSPTVEPVSIDEGYLEMSENPDPLAAAKELQQRLYSELGLPASIGIAPNKFLAKMASNLKKPLGLVVLRKRDVAQQLWPLPVGKMHWVGEKTEQRLNRLGIYTIKDLALADRHKLKEAVGGIGEKLIERAHGIDFRPVNPEARNECKTIGSQTTLPRDITTTQMAKPILAELSLQVSRRLKRKGTAAGGLQLVLKDHRFRQRTKSRKLPCPLRKADEIYEAALRLWKAHWDGTPLRLIGITAIHLLAPGERFEQLDLFHVQEYEKNEKLWETVQQLQKKFGESTIAMGGTFVAQRSAIHAGGGQASINRKRKNG